MRPLTVVHESERGRSPISSYEPSADEMRIACLAGNHRPVVMETITFYAFSSLEPDKILRRTKRIMECSVCSEPLYDVPVDAELPA